MEVKVDDSSEPDGFRDAFDVIRLGNFGAASFHLLHDFFRGAANGFIEDFIREDDISLTGFEALTIGAGHHPELDMDRAVGDFRIAHPPDELEDLLEVQPLLSSNHVDIARRGVGVPAVDARCGIACLIQRRAIGFAQQAAWILVIKVNGDRA